MEAHARLDLDVAVAAQARHPVAARPARRHADTDHVAAVMAPVVRQAGPIHDALPRGIDVAERRAGPHGAEHRRERVLCHRRHLACRIGRAPDMDQSAERRMVAGDAAGELHEDGIPVREAGVAPGRVLLAEPRRRADEGAEPGRRAAGDVIARWHSAATSRSLAPARMRSIAACAAASETAAACRMKACSAGLFTMRRSSTSPVASTHSARGQARRSTSAKPKARPADHASMPMRPDARPSSFRSRRRNIGRRLVVLMALEAGILDVIGDRHPLHGARDEHHLAAGGNDQHDAGRNSPDGRGRSGRRCFRATRRGRRRGRARPSPARTAASRASNSAREK